MWKKPSRRMRVNSRPRPLSALLERAEQLLVAAADDSAEAQAMLDDLRTAAGIPRRPPGRSDSANPSQEFCKSRSNSAK
jgi:hypothetical protein